LPGSKRGTANSPQTIDKAVNTHTHTHTLTHTEKERTQHNNNKHSKAKDVDVGSRWERIAWVDA